MKKTFNLISLGCPKNLVDSEVIYGLLEKDGWTGVDEPAAAQFLIVNTCGFIQPAVEESVEEILELALCKKDDPQKKIVVVGCLVQRYGQALLSELSEVDLFVGTEGVGQISVLLGNLMDGNILDKLVLPPLFLMDSELPRKLSTPFYRGWMKITEGCNNRCSYCLIPSIRGELRSRKIEDLVREALVLEKNGVRELTFVAQDLTAYGMDNYGTASLVQLLKELLVETDISWFRLMYLYPSGISDRLLRLVAENDRILPYMDIPIQHGSDRILQAMNRRYSSKDMATLFRKIRDYVPDIALRTTILVGFPGETDEDIDQLVDLLKTVRFSHVGVFTYANEAGCPAEHLAGQIDEAEKKNRAVEVMEVQSRISAELLKQHIGKIEPVLIEGVSRETDLLLEGRTRYQAPDVDGCVLINEGTACPGDILEVEITEAQTYDLVGRIAITVTE